LEDAKIFNEHHVYFQYEQSETYVKDMLETVLNSI
jgi:hypothetical protein